MLISILCIAFLVLAVFPIWYAVLIYKKKSSGVLEIQQDRTRDPRYFGKSFSAMIWSRYILGSKTIQLSREEELYNINEDDFQEKEIEKVIIATKSLQNVPPKVELQKEIFAFHHLCLEGDSFIRSAYAEGNLLIGPQTDIVRWVDAKGTTTIYDNCNLGISATSASALCIGKNCKFRRLYAPVILLGQYPGETIYKERTVHTKPYHLKVYKNRVRNISYIKDSMINEEGIIPFSVITKNDLVVTEKLVIQGDIRSSQAVRLCEEAVVCGNIFAEGDVILGKNTCVLGNVFTQGGILMEDGAVVGRSENVSSVIARTHIHIKERAIVFGYIGCEVEGLIAPCTQEENPQHLVALKFLQNDEAIIHLSFNGLEDFETANSTGFRNCVTLEDVVIPEGATKIDQSMFYGCSNLKRVLLPNTIQVIENYAFAGCTSLEDFPFVELVQLEKIGDHAFENCVNLKEAILPEELKSVGNAAFMNCRKLSNVHFPKGKQLESAGTHLFRGSLMKEENINYPIDQLPEGHCWFSPVAEHDAIRKLALKDGQKQPIYHIETETFEKNVLSGVECTSKKAEKLTKTKLARTHKQQIHLHIFQGIGATAVVALMCAAGIWGSHLSQQYKEKEQLAEARALYHNQGLLESEALDKTHDLVKDSYVLYRDRVCMRYTVKDEDLNKVLLTYQDIDAIVPKEIQKHMMVVPLRIQYETDAEKYRNQMKEKMLEFYAALPESYNKINLFDGLYPYQDRYIFYRTENCWTSEGAYYGANLMMESMGSSLPELTDYLEYMYNSFHGTAWKQVKEKITSKKYTDKIYYYLLPNSNTVESLTVENDEDQMITRTEPIISKSRAGISSFIGGRFHQATFEGGIYNGKTILVIGDSNADVIASYFLSEYEKIIVINGVYNKYDKESFLALLKDEHVSDILFVQGPESFSKLAYRQGIGHFVKEKTK